MDFSLLFDPEYLPIIVATLLGFALLAAVLLVPVYRFLDREQKVAKKWTPEALAERMREDRTAATNGTGRERSSSNSEESTDSTASSA